jgi:hypothetical protein
VQAIARMEIQTIAMRDDTPAIHRQDKYSYVVSDLKVPTSFQGVTEARAHLEQIIAGSMYWYSRTEVTPHSYAIALGSDKVLQDNKLCSERDTFLAKLEDWDRAFQPLRGRMEGSGNQKLLRGAKELRIVWLDAEDDALPSEKSREGLPARQIFSFDVCIIHPLAMIGLRFRHRKLRKEALAILKHSNRVEGVWHGPATAKAIEWLIDVEENGLADDVEYVPHEKTLQRMTMKSDDTNRAMIFKGVLQVGDQLVRKEVMFPWH